MRAHAVEDARAHARAQIGSITDARRLREHGGKASERSRLLRACGIDPLAVAGGQRADLAIEGKGLRHAAKQVEADEARRLRIARDALAREQRLHLARNAMPATTQGTVAPDCRVVAPFMV
jgi:hypothetical protein